MKQYVATVRRYSALVSITVLATLTTEAAGPPGPPPPARAIPGINAKDPFPRACVDCHVRLPEQDVRLSTLMAKWTEAVEPALLDRAKAAAPGLALAGKHPAVPEALGDVPAACLTCHGKDSTTAPPFGRMLHAIHLGGGESSHYLTLFQGECTHCHKLDLKTGVWSLPSGAEK